MDSLHLKIATAFFFFYQPGSLDKDGGNLAVVLGLLLSGNRNTGKKVKLENDLCRA